MDTCTRWENLLVDYIDGHLDDHDRRNVDRHLASCPACRARLAEEGWLSDRLRADANRWPIERLLVWPPMRSRLREKSGSRRALVPAFLGILLPSLVALAVIVAGRWQSTTTDEAPSSDAVATSANSPPASDDERFAELETAIEREACAARLAMSAELLAAEHGAERHAAETLRLVAEVFPETEAGRAAAQRDRYPW